MSAECAHVDKSHTIDDIFHLHIQALTSVIQAWSDEDNASRVCACWQITYDRWYFSCTYTSPYVSNETWSDEPRVNIGFVRNHRRWCLYWNRAVSNYTGFDLINPVVDKNSLVQWLALVNNSASVAIVLFMHWATWAHFTNTVWL